jgi:hypothetical protein
VVDELLVHAAELLEPGRAAVEVYLTAVAADVADHLRPRVRAAVLVEDRLVAEDHRQLLDEAVERGLDRGRAQALLAAVAAELGAAVETTETVAPTAPPARAAGDADRGWADLLRAARAELRAGRPAAAARLVAQAEALAGTDGRTQVRALADEVTAELARVPLTPTGPGSAPLGSTGPGPTEPKPTGPEPSGPAPTGPEPPASVTAVRLSAGSVRVSWRGPAGAEFRVRCLQPDGRWRVVGRTRAAEIEDGGAPLGPVGVYSVSAAGSDGSRSAEARSDR